MKMPEETLRELTAATHEAKATIRELHEARAALLDIDKKQRERITTLIVAEVTRQVGELSQEARTQLAVSVAAVIDSLATELRSRLAIG